MTGQRRFSYWLPAVAMMLGWGLRGFIGGGPFGAMIPGAMVALTLCYLYPRRDVSVIAAFAAVGVGIGGEMTYGQTIGFIVKAETFWWGFLGLALKGAIWGALAGGVIALGFRPRPTAVLGAAVTMAVATQIGWKFINEPKLVYFSNLLDRPRPEIWAGFLLASIALVAYLAWLGQLQPALRFAAVAFVGGGIGFGLGGAIQGVGRIFTPNLNLHWWKYMEFFFGLCFGWALSWAWQHSDTPDSGPVEGGPSIWLELIAGAAIVAGLFWLSWNTQSRFAYLLAGGAALYLVAKYRWLAKHIAYSATFTGIALDLARYWSKEYQHGPAGPAYTAAVIASVAFAWYVIRWDGNTRKTLELLMWACVVDAVVKFAIHPKGIGSVVDHICIGFVLMAIGVSWMMRAEIINPSCDSSSSSVPSVAASGSPSI